jgi:hypothetical protein
MSKDRERVVLVEVLSNSAIVDWTGERSRLRAIELVLRVVANIADVPFPPAIRAFVAEWDFTAIPNGDAAVASSASEFVTAVLPIVQSCRYNPVVLICGAMTFFAATSVPDGIEFGTTDSSCDFETRVVAEFEGLRARSADMTIAYRLE